MAADGTSGGSSSDSAIDMGLLPDLIGFHLRCAQVAFFQHFSDGFPIRGGDIQVIQTQPGKSRPR